MGPLNLKRWLGRSLLLGALETIQNSHSASREAQDDRLNILRRWLWNMLCYVKYREGCGG